jgi:Tol biopolymer transport system component
VSPDGRYGAVTFFVVGHSYATPGSFSTQTTIIDLASKKKIVNIERFRVTKDGKEFDSPDFNFWGVTFAKNSDRFYATLSSRGKTYLVVASVRDRTARVLREGVECPSLSPDGTRIAFKKRIGDGARWRLYVLDLATLQDHPLAETRSVDDQAEWLDDGHVLYGLDEAVWLVRADGTGLPRRLLMSADSPAVVGRL